MRRWVWQMWVGAVCAVAVAGCKTTCPECEKRKAALPCVGDDCAAAKLAPTSPDVATKPLPTFSDAIAANKPRELTPSANPVPITSTIIVPSLDVPTLLPVPSVPTMAAPAPILAPTPAPTPTPNLVVPVAQPEATVQEPVKEPIVVQRVTPAPLAPKAATFDRASNYQWLIGEVTYLSAKKEWRLRYTSLGANEADAYGGSVTLTGSADLLDALKDGQTVRVEGEMLERQPRIAPPYRVAVVKVLD